MRRIARLLSAALPAFLILCTPLPASADDAAEQAQIARDKEDAVDRVAQSHDETLITSTAALIVKQISLRLARDLLADWGKAENLGPGWKAGNAHWMQAEAALMRETVSTRLATVSKDAWVKEIRRQYVSTTFAGEEADTIATHFETESGKAQVAMLDWFMGETTLFNYTFAGRFQYDLNGAEAELKALQKAANARIPAKDNELQFSTKYREGFQFIACSPDSPYCPGVKYARLLAIPLQGAIIRHIDDVAREVEKDMRSRRELVAPFIDAFKAGR
ncbi:MAG: hypothetical protein KIT73_11430 [Burkholderiales bacterium]|nr:hypothetical protein [Burkholderiales bacterium]